MFECAGSHPNLVPFKGWYIDSSNVLCLVLGHCEGGTLMALLKVREGVMMGTPAAVMVFGDDFLHVCLLQLVCVTQKEPLSLHCLLAGVWLAPGVSRRLCHTRSKWPQSSSWQFILACCAQFCFTSCA